MSYFKFPSSLRWIWVACLILIAAMIIYRLVIMGIFCDDWTLGQQSVVFFHGLLNDFGVVGAIAIVLTVTGLIPGLHPYKRRKGKRTALILFMIAGFMLLATNMVDLYFLRDFERRPTGEDWSTIFSNENAGLKFRKSFPLVGALVVTAIVLFTWWLILRWLHTALGTFARADEKKLRLMWQGTTFVVAGLLLIIAILNFRAMESSGTIQYNDGKSAFRYSTIQLAFKKPQVDLAIVSPD